MTTAYDFSTQSIDGAPLPLSAYRGDVMLIVNTASQCGFTSQYGGLEALWRKHKDEGFVVVGFPCNQFGGQEPGDAAEITNFCNTRYDVTFPLAHKIDVNGANADPFYEWLKAEKPGLLGSEAIKWNFTKFLIGRNGLVIDRYAPTTTPESLDIPVVEALAKPKP